MSAAAAPAPTRTAPIALWRVAQAFLNTLYSLFGAPEDVARLHTCVRKEHQLIASWLRCLEAVLRRLLLIEASAYAQPNTRPLLRPSRKRVPRMIGFDADAPQSWRVSFRCFTSPMLRHAQHDAGGDAGSPVSVSLSLSKAERPAPQSFHSAWPLAERYEACVRVFNDPTAYAQRLSRRMHAAPHRVVEVLRAPPEAEHRVDRFEALTHQAEQPWRPFYSSA